MKKLDLLDYAVLTSVGWQGVSSNGRMINQIVNEASRMLDASPTYAQEINRETVEESLLDLNVEDLVTYEGDRYFLTEKGKTLLVEAKSVFVNIYNMIKMNY